MMIAVSLDAATGADEPKSLLPEPAGNFGYFEGVSYKLARPSDSLTLVIDDEEIAGRECGDGWHWIWRPGFYSGMVRAELVGAERQVLGRYRIDVSPSPGKIGQDMFMAMIEEIRRGLPELLPGSEPAAGAIGRDGHQAEDLVLLSRLRHYAHDCQRALSAVLARPRTRIGSTRTQVPVHRAKRIDPRAAHQLARAAPWLARAIGDQSVHENSVIGRQLSVASYQIDMDSAPNRAIKALVDALRRRSRQLERSLTAMLQQPDPGGARSDVRSRLPRRLEFLDSFGASMTRLLRNEPLCLVTRSEISAAGLNAVSADPAYARAYQLGRRALCLGVAGTPEDMSWLSPTWEIYERWCYLGLLEAISKLMPVAEPVRVLKPACNATAEHTLHSAGCCVQLMLQPSIPSGDQKPSAGFRSVSGPREPDIVLRLTTGSVDKFICFDAKYRVSRQNVLDAMGSAHIYRDSLRLNGNPSEMSCLLVPKGGGAPWLESGAFRLETGVGVIPFSPDSPRDALMLALRRFLATGMPASD